jgi:prepilin-type N-terminal cleavage/methylation domain-containing protein
MIMTPQSRRRHGFTLIELLVVIAIIAILMALVSAGVFKYFEKIPELTTKNEISQLSNALNAFKAKYKMYPPSRIFLANTEADYTNATHPSGLTQAERMAHLGLLRKIWPRLAPPAKYNPQFDWTAGAAPSNWTGMILEGDQCLVFFLSGIPSPPSFGAGGLGFSTDGQNPTWTRAKAAPGGDTKFFDFTAGRLVIKPGTQYFYSYVDGYGTSTTQGAQAYAYFSAGARANQYNPGDCLGIRAVPYLQSPLPTSRYYNPDSFQILSAGKDKTFALPNYPAGAPVWLGGPAVVCGWTAANAEVDAAGVGEDDISNFHGSFMGVP